MAVLAALTARPSITEIHMKTRRPRPPKARWTPQERHETSPSQRLLLPPAICDPW